MSATLESGPIAFGPFVLDVSNAQLVRVATVVPLSPRPFGLLCFLVQHPGRLIARDEILDAVWGHRHVSDSVLKNAVNTLRGALQDDPKNPQWIETVPRRGYRFIGSVAAAMAPVRPERTAGSEHSAGSNVPRVLGVLHGRADTLAATLGLLQQNQCVTLCGTGGVGKTRLALAIAHEWQVRAPDGVWWLSLEALTDGDGLRALTARTLGLGETEAATSERLSAALRGHEAMLVFDNAEHLLPELSQLVRSLLSEAVSVKVLVTSREPLHIRGERVCRVEPLASKRRSDDADEPLPPAVALFLERVHAIDPSLVPDSSELAEVEEVCDALDGLPLALELAAARVPLLGIKGVGNQMCDRLNLLTRNLRDSSPRHRTLRDALEWSHGLLSATERVVFRRLGVFSGSFSLAAAQAVAAGEDLSPWEVVDAIDALAEKSLLTREPSVSTSGWCLVAESATKSPVFGGEVGRRMRMLETVRAFALDELAAHGDDPHARVKHLHWVLSHFRQVDAAQWDIPTLELLQLLSPDADNLRAALRFAQAEPSMHEDFVELVGLAVQFWHRACLWAEAGRWCKAAWDLASSTTPPAVKARLLQAEVLLFIHGIRVDRVAALRTAEDACTLHCKLRDPFSLYYSLYQLCCLKARVGADDGFTALLEEMREVEEPRWSLQRRAIGRMAVAIAAKAIGDMTTFHESCKHELAISRAIGDRSYEWTLTRMVAMMEFEAGRVTEARALLEPAVAEMNAAGRSGEHAPVIALLCSLCIVSGDMARAVPLLRQTLKLLQTDGLLHWMASVLPMVAAAQQRMEDAAMLYGWVAARSKPPPNQWSAIGKRLYEDCRRLLRAAFDETRLQQLADSGTALDNDSALGLLLGRALTRPTLAEVAEACLT